MDMHTAIEAFASLSHESRLATFRLLVRAGPNGVPAGEIAEALAAKQNTMSTHLAILSRAGLVKRHREGRIIRYSADYAGMRDLLMFIMTDCCEGNAEICAPVLEAMNCQCE